MEAQIGLQFVAPNDLRPAGKHRGQAHGPPQAPPTCFGNAPGPVTRARGVHFRNQSGIRTQLSGGAEAFDVGAISISRAPGADWSVQRREARSTDELTADSLSLLRAASTQRRSQCFKTMSSTKRTAAKAIEPTFPLPRGRGENARMIIKLITTQELEVSP